ncbi:MAG: ABC transporter ATP-binding protein [Acidobacteria bacterium]|nr:ABC transporter ATP-binding protein [Acidobacteriota bacterium]
MTQSEPAVEVRDLVKEFPAPGGGTIRAVDGVSFSVRRGEIFGFLGPNGAGKTTTLEVVEGLASPTSGQTFVLGSDSHKDAARVKSRIGVQLQAAAYFDHLRLDEILELFGSFYPRSVSPDVLLAKVGLSEKRRARLKELSGGQAQRFSIVAAMVNDPEVLFLDEPTTGLDPQARRHLWDVIGSINREEGKTIVLTTHYMEEAELLCDRVAIIDNGRIVALDTPLGLVRQLPAAYRIAFATGRAIDEEDLARLPGVAEVAALPNGERRYELRVRDPQATLFAFTTWARDRQVALDDVRVSPATLEEVFLSLTGHALRE